MIDWGVAATPHPGEEVSGDLHVIARHETGVLVAVIDALGHGPQAAEAAALAASILTASPQRSLEWLFEQCHEALLRARGVAMAAASYDTDGSLTWLSVGNVEAVLVSAATSRPDRSSLLVRGGAVGFRLPLLRPSVMPVQSGDTLIIATDGVRYNFGGARTAGISPQALAEQILKQHVKGTDDALVLVTKVRGSN